jgi:hypothetical protein
MSSENSPKKRPNGLSVAIKEIIKASVVTVIKSLETPEIQNILRLILLEAIAAYFASALLAALATIVLVQVILWSISNVRLHIRWESVLVFFQSGWGTMLATAIVVIAGCSLYILRATRRATYGIMEFCFAVAVCWVSVRKLNLEDFGAWAVVLSSAYLIVRGLDNFMEGMKKPENTPSSHQPYGRSGNRPR